MHLSPADVFTPPANPPPPSEIIVLDDQQTAALLTRQYEMLAVALAVHYEQIDVFDRAVVGLNDDDLNDIVTQAVLFGVRVMADADAEEMCLADRWEDDVQMARRVPGIAYIPNA